MTSSFNDRIAVLEQSPVAITLSVKRTIAAMAAKQTKAAREWQFFFTNWAVRPQNLNASLIRDTHGQ